MQRQIASVAREAAAAEGLRQLELAALPTGLDWHVWWNERLAEQQRDGVTYDGWERALVEACTRLVRNQLTLARLIRYQGGARNVIRYDSDGQVCGEETMDPKEMTREALAWCIHSVLPAKKDAPEKFHILFRAIEGCFLQQARLGIELSAIKKRGYLTLNHSASAPNPQAFHEMGLERDV